MPYNFTIGEALPQIPSQEDVDSGMDRAEMRWHADPMRDPDMPNGWSCWDSGYYDWAVFCRAVGLEDLLLRGAPGEGSPELVPSHPGAARLSPRHLLRFRDALERAPEAHRPCMEWLVAWTERALEVCGVPIFYNR